MLSGRVIHDGHEYCVKVGSVTTNITGDVRALIDQARSEGEQKIAEQRAAHADIIARYNQIVGIIFANGGGMPTGG